MAEMSVSTTDTQAHTAWMVDRDRGRRRPVEESFECPSGFPVMLGFVASAAEAGEGASSPEDAK